MKTKPSFGSRFGTIAAVGGSVVGLGNIWRFPYLTGENGGAAFILIYLSVSFLIAVPTMIAEFSIGRHAMRNPMRSFKKLAPNTGWIYLGFAGVLTGLMIITFYSVLGGWAVEFLRFSYLDAFKGKSAPEVAAFFTAFTQNGWTVALYSGIFVLATFAIVATGVEKGIERFNKVLMPLLVIILLALVFYSTTLSGFKDGIRFLLKPDFSKVGFSTVLAAAGQAFFSMSLGMGAMITYGNYIRKKDNLKKVAGTVAVVDFSIALLAGFVVFPAVFSFGIEPQSGPKLVFITLPNLFQQMPGGYWLSIAFFILLILAAVTSSISLFEVIARYIQEEFRQTRMRASIITGGMVLAASTVCALSMVDHSSIRIFGENIFDLFDYLTTTFMMPLGALFTVLFVAWFWKGKGFEEEVTNRGHINHRFFVMLRFVLRYLVPLVLGALFIDLLLF